MLLLSESRQSLTFDLMIPLKQKLEFINVICDTHSSTCTKPEALITFLLFDKLWGPSGAVEWLLLGTIVPLRCVISEN